MKTLLALILTACVAFSAGFYTKGRFVEADRVQGFVEAQKEVVNDVFEAAKTNDRIEEKNDQTEKRTEKAKSVVRKAPVVVLEPVVCPERESAEVLADEPRTSGTPAVDRGVYLTSRANLRFRNE